MDNLNSELVNAVLVVVSFIIGLFVNPRKKNKDKK
ncbi:hypothetical protein HMPREF1173_00031 [Prevotella nigrescens CC14M]|uniref:Uncharacterized protein n=1 Tax=Prevotella nigrescens CC14M TaxID=1073366 RepID=V8CR65_9BACT|nr:hypothetical protein HMPREF1173_00031 [Prevotella nigrescens CC14M]